MKKNAKSFIAVASIMALALSLTADVGAINTVTATPSTHTFSVDGEVKPMAAYVINGNNYLKLRDIAAVRRWVVHVSAQFWFSVCNRTIRAKSPFLCISSPGVPISVTVPLDNTTILLAFSTVLIR